MFPHNAKSNRTCKTHSGQNPLSFPKQINIFYFIAFQITLIRLYHIHIFLTILFHEFVLLPHIFVYAILKTKSSLTIYEEYFMIRLCKTQKICIFILGLMLIFGMCSDTSKTDSYFCVVPHSEHSDSDILYNNTRTELTLCTPEALNNSGKNTPENLISRYIIRRNNTAKSFYWLCPSLILPSNKDYFSDYSVNFFYTQKTDDGVINYLHKSDGKKRI